MQKDKVLYFYPEKSPFIQKDIDALSEQYIVSDYALNVKQKWMLPLGLLKQFFFLVITAHSSKYIVCRFGGYHAVFPVIFSRIFRKKNLIILGGVECHCIPEIGYGFCTNTLLSKIMYFIQKYSDKIVVVHRSLYDTYYSYFNTKGKQGLKHLYQTPKKKVIELKNGYNSKIFYDQNKQRKFFTFVTATGSINHQTFYLKGLDLILEVCRKKPEIEVSVVGDLNLYIADIPDNFKIIPKLNPKALADVYNQHTFYLQLSMAEGFPNALCEAMLCGCVPIGSNVFGIPEIIGDAGFLLMKKNIDELIQIIENLKNFDIELLSKSAQNRILENFSLNARNERLLSLLNFY